MPILSVRVLSGFKWLSILTADQSALSSHVVFSRGDGPDMVSSAHCASWTGDPTYGHVEPHTGAILELARLGGLAKDMTCLKMMRPQIMLFTMLEKAGRVPVRRLFIRCALLAPFPMQHQHSQLTPCCSPCWRRLGVFLSAASSSGAPCLRRSPCSTSTPSSHLAVHHAGEGWVCSCPPPLHQVRLACAVPHAAPALPAHTLLFTMLEKAGRVPVRRLFIRCALLAPFPMQHQHSQLTPCCSPCWRRLGVFLSAASSSGAPCSCLCPLRVSRMGRKGKGHAVLLMSQHPSCAVGVLRIAWDGECICHPDMDVLTAGGL